MGLCPLGPKAIDGKVYGWFYSYLSWLGPELCVCCLAHLGSTGVFLLLRS